MNYGKTIKRFRVERLGLTQIQFSESVGISQTYLSQLEGGKKKPSTELLERIAEFVLVPMPVLLWSCISEKDVTRNNRIEAFRIVKPALDKMIESFFKPNP